MRFIPTVTSLEQRCVLDGEMPNGLDAFVPVDPNPPIFADGALTMDIDGNFPASPYYLTGVADPGDTIPDPAYAPDPNADFNLEKFLDRQFEKPK